jgi:hypothetical protein
MPLKFLHLLQFFKHYINEGDAVREVLMALQGRKNVLLTWSITAQSQSFVVRDT